MKKILICLVLVLANLLMSVPVCAADTTPEGIPEGATKHTIVVEVPPATDETDEDGNEITPYIWENPSVGVGGNSSVNTNSFYVSDKYFGFEMKSSSNANAKYSVALKTALGSTLVNSSGWANGGTYKEDWIELPGSSNYYFRVSNGSSSSLTVTLTYYSWN